MSVGHPRCPIRLVSGLIYVRLGSLADIGALISDVSFPPKSGHAQRLSYEYNLFEIQRTHIKAKDKLPTGKVKIEVETTYVEPSGSPEQPSDAFRSKHMAGRYHGTVGRTGDQK